MAVVLALTATASATLVLFWLPDVPLAARQQRCLKGHSKADEQVIGWQAPQRYGFSGPFTSCLAVLLAMDVIVPSMAQFRPREHVRLLRLFGFIACVVLVLVAKPLRTVLKRPENYYDS